MHGIEGASQSSSGMIVLRRRFVALSLLPYTVGDVSAQKRRKAAKRRTLRSASQAVAPGPSLPRPIRLVVEGFERVEQYAEVLHDPTAAAALAEARLSEAAQNIARLTAPCDAFEVLELVRMHNALADPETYRETEHEGSAAVIELTALIVAARGSGARSAAPDGDAIPRPEQIIEDVETAAREAINAGSMLIMFSAALDSDPFRRMSFGARLREVSVRNVAYAHMVEDTLTALFDEPVAENACCTVLGCTVREIRQVFSALQALQEDAWSTRFAALREFGQMAASATHAPGELSPDLVGRCRELWAWIWDNPAACSVFADDVIAARAGVDVGIVRTVLELFTTPLVARPPAEAALEFFQGRSPLRVRPILRDPDGSSVGVHGGLLIPAIRERVEQGLRADQGAWDAYSKYRGQHLEEAAADLVAACLPSCTSHLGLEYFVPATDIQTEPAQYTKLVEGDGLLVVDDVAVVIEGKAVALRAQSRTGDPLRLRQDLRRIVTDAADQSERLRRRILDDGGLRLRDNSWLEPQHRPRGAHHGGQPRRLVRHRHRDQRARCRRTADRQRPAVDRFSARPTHYQRAHRQTRRALAVLISRRTPPPRSTSCSWIGRSACCTAVTTVHWSRPCTTTVDQGPTQPWTAWSRNTDSEASKHFGRCPHLQGDSGGDQRNVDA